MKTSSKPTRVQLPPDRKSSCSIFGSLTASAGLLLALLLGSSLNASAFILDDFNDGSSLDGWSGAALGGSAVQSGGQVMVTPAPVAGLYTFIKKTDRTFTNLATHTLEFKVLVNSILTNGVTTNGLAILGWAPTGANPGSSGGGYFIGVGPSTVQVWANTAPIYATNLSLGSYSLSSSNLYLAMRMTPAGTSMIVKSTVYAKADGRYNVLFEYTATNSAAPTMIGTGGNALLGAFNDASGAATSVSFDDLQYFDTTRELVDDFSGPYPGSTWTGVTPGVATNYNDGAGHLVTFEPISAGGGGGAYRSDKTYRISDGVRLEFRADVYDASAMGGDFTVLGYMPAAPGGFGSLVEYHVAFNAIQMYVGKAYGSWWEAAYTPPLGFVPMANVRLIQTLTGEGTAVRIESRLEDLSLDVNDPGRVVYQRMRLDSSSAYINVEGSLAISQFNTGSGVSSPVYWDSVEVNASATGNAPPIIGGLAPADGKNFHEATNGVAFNVTDDASAPLNNIKLILNGVTYTNGSPGVTITPSTVSSLSRNFTFTNLAPNVFYKGSIQASDNLGASSTVHYEFDTFLTNNLQVESEDFNYSSNPGVDGGLFFDTGPWAYNGLQGSQDIDYHDSRTSGDSDDPAHYRDLDFPRTYLTGESSRAQYVIAGVPELLTYDNENGDWRNYTRTIPAGTYQVYSRQSTFALSASLVTLERVTSDTTTSNQIASSLGAFVQLGDVAGDTGYDVHRDVPLTDASGNPTVVRLAGGITTLRVTDRYVNNDEDSDVFHNYLVLVPTSDPGTLRPILTQTIPVAGSTSRQGLAATEPLLASIANRDTTVTNIVALKMNGVNVAFTTTNTANGKDVGWSLSVVPAAPAITNTLIYQDSDGVSITNTWSYSYPFLRATNRLVGALSTRGFDVRMVQADSYPDADNTIAKGEAQLSIPPEVPYDRTWRTNVQTLDWNDNTGIPNYVPGLDNGPSGYPSLLGGYDYIATEELAYLELAAGAHRFVVISDDSFELRSGKNLTDTGATVLGSHNGSSGNPRSFDFVVEAGGLYPMRGMWQEEGGGANFSLSALNPISGTNNVVNDSADPAGVTKVFVPGIPTVLLSSATVGGPYAARADAVINTTTKTVTLPISGSMQFYRMSSSSVITILSITVVGSNVVITYL